MDGTVLFALILTALILGAVLGAMGVRLRDGSALASATTERDLLRERVEDLQLALGDTQSASASVAPLNSALSRVERQVRELEQARTAQFAEVAQRLGDVMAGTARLGDETARLTGSLNASSVRGSWGEVQLKRVLELSGMLDRCDFSCQYAGTNSRGEGVRPDVVVHLPGGKHLVIDAKTPMTGFLAAQGDGLSDADREHRLRQHAAALRGHVDTLAAKAYWTALPGTPELVVCFVPGEAILAAALLHDPGLHEHAMTRKVVLASPATLLATLRSVAYAWRAEALTDSASALLEVGRELYERLATLGQHAARMGAALTRSVTAYNTLVGSLESRVMVTARRLDGLGITEGTLVVLEPLEVMARPLTAAELLDRLDEEVARPELEFPALGKRPQSPGEEGGDEARAS